MYAAALTRKTATCMCIFVVLAQSSTPSAGGNAKDAIRLEFVNELKDPHFDFFISLHTTTAKTIKELLEEAAWKDPTFKFSMEYYGSIPGYLVSGIRKDQNSGPHGRQPWVFGDVNWDTDHSIWATWINGDSIPTTASTFQPKQGDIVTFNLTQW